MKNQVHLLVSIKAYAGKEEQLRSVLKKLCQCSRDEQGCIEYLYGEVPGESIFYIKETWQDREALKLHEKTEHFSESGSLIKTCCETVGVHTVNWQNDLFVS